MVHTFLVLLALTLAHAKIDRVLQEGYLGEKRLESYSERYQPLIFQDLYQGKLVFEDDLFVQGYLNSYLFSKERELSYFLKSELQSGLSCPNEYLNEHFDEIRYSYRLITLSYLLEAQWHEQMVSKHFRFKNGCNFELKKWLETCRPVSQNMKSFVSKMKKFNPRYEENLPMSYVKTDWWKDYHSKNFKYYSHYRTKEACGENCQESELENEFRKSCESDQNLMTLICSENDEILGLSVNRDAYSLVAISNIINTYNKRGEAIGCLRRFSEVMAHKEVHYPILDDLFPSIRNNLLNLYKERYVQGRVFFYGSGKEFEEKGLSDLYVMEQPLKVESLPLQETKFPAEAPKVTETPKVEAKKADKVQVKASEIATPTKKIQKSAFLQAAEARALEKLDLAEVDMQKLKYDYVFSLNMINKLSDRLKGYMTREALSEMMTYDKLGTKEGPVPLLFIKFMIDMQEHAGLYNLVSILGDKFYVSNELDESFRTNLELVHLTNNDATGHQWQLYILRP